MATKRIAIETPVANPPVTLTPEAFKALMDEMQALREAVQAKPAAPAKPDQSSQNDWLCIKAFQKRGYKDVKPRINVMTYNLWVKAGRKVKEGEHAIPVANLRLFHVSQTEPMPAKDRTAFLAKLDAKAAEREAKAAGKVVPMGPSASKLPPVTLVAAEPARAPKKARRPKAAPTDQPTA